MSFRKRAFDVICSFVGVVVLSPVLLLVSLAIMILDGQPILFRQERIGHCGRVFHIYKFRTMVPNAGELGQPLTVGRDTRITRVGHWLRKSKLDELPQLLNVLKGEMSLVGPRPEVPKYVALYTHAQRQVLELVPGITDPASIAFRNEADLLAGCENPERAYLERIMPEKIRLNLAYAANAGLKADVGVIWQTLAALCVKTTRDI